MKVEMTPLERGYTANLLRRRAMEAAHNAASTIEDRQRVEFEQEAQLAEVLAIRFDDAEDILMERKNAPAVVNQRRDIDVVDKPQ